MIDGTALSAPVDFLVAMDSLSARKRLLRFRAGQLAASIPVFLKALSRVAPVDHADAQQEGTTMRTHLIPSENAFVFELLGVAEAMIITNSLSGPNSWLCICKAQVFTASRIKIRIIGWRWPGLLVGRWRRRPPAPPGLL
jgi:hypothetical protein